MKSRLFFLLSFLIVLVACAQEPTPVPTFAPIPTSIPLTSTPTAIPAVEAGTPIPLPNTAISVENVNHLTQLARWGNGTIVQIEASPDGTLLAVATPLGIHLYDTETFVEVSFIEVKNWLTSISFSNADESRDTTGDLLLLQSQGALITDVQAPQSGYIQWRPGIE